LQHKQPSHTTLTTRSTTNPHNQTLTTSSRNLNTLSELAERDALFVPEALGYREEG
jgi:hypothetical protein